MAHPSKRKGDRAELEIARILSDLLGLDVRRALGAGRADDVGDLHGIPDVCAEVKNYQSIARAIDDGLADLEREQANASVPFGVVFVRRPGGGDRWIAVMDVPRWATYYREAML